MSPQMIYEKTMNTIRTLPQSEVEKVNELIELMQKHSDEKQWTQIIQKLANESQTFAFLNEEEDLYTVKDLKEKYND